MIRLFVLIKNECKSKILGHWFRTGSCSRKQLLSNKALIIVSIGTNLYLTKVIIDIVVKHTMLTKVGFKIEKLNERTSDIIFITLLSEGDKI